MPSVEYMKSAYQQCETKDPIYGVITSKDQLEANLIRNCLPTNIKDYEMSHDENFLVSRRKSMAEKIKPYYYSL